VKMTKPSEQTSGITVDRGRWELEWDSARGEMYVLHDGVTEEEFSLSYEDMRDLRFCIALVSEMRQRDLKLRTNNNKEE